jgi:hypothetical protein
VLDLSPRRALLLVPPTAAVLELLHPTWPDDAIVQVVAPVVGWWLAVHVLLVCLVPVVLWTLSLELPPGGGGSAFLARTLLVTAALANAAFIAADGLGTGLLILNTGSADSAAALTTVWNSPVLIALADIAGGAFALAVLTTASALYPDARRGVPFFGLVVTALAFLASALPGGSQALLVSRIAALVAGAAVVYRSGAHDVPFALLVFAAVLPQHVGPPAALGMLLIGAALLFRGRSSPAAACPP